jgi:hypothetical protein
MMSHASIDPYILLEDLLRRRADLDTQISAVLKTIELAFGGSNACSLDNAPVPAAQSASTDGDLFQEQPDKPSGSNQPSAVDPVDAPRIIGGAALVAELRQILVDAGRPMQRGEIYSELLKRGVLPSGAHPKNNLGTTLWANEHLFINLPGFGYWVRDTPYPPLRYIPTDEVDCAHIEQLRNRRNGSKTPSNPAQNGSSKEDER